MTNTCVDRFRRWRASRDWSQHDLARELGISQALVSSIERGDTVVTKLALAKRIQELSREWPEGPIRIEEWVEAGHDQIVEPVDAVKECA
jgi:transcriptional regulator with XRE-family HTH domain